MTVAPTTSANQVTYQHGSLREFYRNGPYGLEQEFTVAKPRAGGGPLVLALGYSGSLRPVLAGSRILFKTRSGVTALVYGELQAVDATGRRLPAQMGIKNRTIELRIGVTGARYPVRIDPFVQPGEKISSVGANYVALSSDGNTALIGAGGGPNTALVFTRSGGTWSQQGPMLIGSGAVNEHGFGPTVALSADGNTALIGGFEDNGFAGAAWVFTRSGSTWTQQGEKLTGAGAIGQAQFGSSVALSADGNTAVIAGDGDNGQGAVWNYTRSGATWTQQGSKLTDGGGFAISVALSSDGNTALIGGGLPNRSYAWVFRRSGETWSQQGPKLIPTGQTGEEHVVQRSIARVALSSDGNTALVSAPRDNEFVGAAWAFTRVGEAWSQEGQKLTAKDETGAGLFGSSVALSSSGNTALIGGYRDNTGERDVGAAWVFTRAGETWSQQGSKITGSGKAEIGKEAFGLSVALSADSSTALISGVGQLWVYVNQEAEAGEPPTVTHLSTTKGPAAGGTTVTITGTGFVSVAAVRFGSTDATHFIVNSPTSITAVSPPGTTGTVEISVTTPKGKSGATSKSRFKYGSPTVTSVTPHSGAKTGGGVVTVTGSGFAPGSATTEFTFGKNAALSVKCGSTTECTMVVPAAQKAGTVDVRAKVGKSSRKSHPADHYTYE